jgi:glucose-1-phosphate adenylyltransferase
MNVLAMVLAGGEGTRLYPLTAEHSKPAVTFVNGCRIVDFVLSNLTNSGISTIYLLAQYKPESLIEHIDTTWAAWARGGPGRVMKVVLPAWGQFHGTADAVYQNLDLLEEHQPDLVAVFASDHVYRMDLRRMVEAHRQRQAEVTVAAVPVPLKDASSLGVIAAGADGRIAEFQEKPVVATAMPGNPHCAYASMGNYLFEPQMLVEVLEEAARSGRTDFGRDILPRLPRRFRAYAYDFTGNYVPGLAQHEDPGYWRDVGTLDALAAARADVAGPRPCLNLSNPLWPIRGAIHAQLLAKLQDWEQHTRNVRPRPRAGAELRAS